MKLLAENSSALTHRIDESCDPETSVVIRYRNIVDFFDDPVTDSAFKALLIRTSIREGTRVLAPILYKGVELHVVDETTRMTTGSMKAIDGCLTAALCLTDGTTRVAFESGGNTGSALTRYCRQSGIETFFFCPLDNIDMLHSGLFAEPEAHLLGVAERASVKEFTALFSESTGIRHLPNRSLRHAASVIRGLFFVEFLLRHGPFQWVSQAVSAAFGPIGIYNVLEKFDDEIHGLPRFLGIQQAANCPLYREWKGGSSGKGDSLEAGKADLLNRVMYDFTPGSYETYGDFHRMMSLSRGEMLTVDRPEFDVYQQRGLDGETLLELLEARGMPVTARSGEIVEKTGLTALAGTLKAIDTGVITSGSRVLCCITGGVTDADANARPEGTLRTREDVLEYVGKVKETQ